MKQAFAVLFVLGLALAASAQSPPPIQCVKAMGQDGVERCVPPSRLTIQGPQGVQGPQGLPGQQGPAGPQGPVGPPVTGQPCASVQGSRVTLPDGTCLPVFIQSPVPPPNTTAAMVVGVTATQAIISYSAPDSNPCSVDVREQGAAAVVHDVAPALFVGAGSDARPGNIGAGSTSRVLVAGKRTAEKAADGKYYSRALQAMTPHAYKITCSGGVVASGTFTTANIMPSTWNDPLAADPNAPGSYAWPTLDVTNPQQQIVDPQTGALIMPFQTHADGSYVSWSATPNLNLCSPVTQTTPSGEKGVLCTSWPDVWFAGDKGVRHVDVMGCISAIWDPVNPNVAHCIGSVGTGWNNISTYTYKGDFSANTAQGGCGCSTLAVSSVTQGNIAGRASTDAFSTIQLVGYVNGNGYFYAQRASQNSWGNLIVWNEASNTVLASTSTLKHNGGPCRWCSIHSTFLSPDGKYFGFYSDDLGGDPTRPGYGPYVSHAVAGSIPSSLVACPTNALGVTGVQCSIIPVDGEPVDPTPRSPDVASVQSAIPGDMVGFAIYDVNSYEFGRLLDKGTDGKTWLIQRGWPYFGTSSFSGWVKAHADPSIYMVCGDRGGIPLGVNPPNPSGGGLAWDWQADPTGETGWTLAAFQGQHGSSNASMIVQPMYSIRTGSTAVALQKAAPDYQVNGNPSWHGVTGTGWPMATDTHPSPPDSANLMLDGHPLNFADNMPQGINVGGDLWKYAPTTAQFDPKHLSTYAYCGDKPLVNVSGPGVTIGGATTDLYKLFYVHVDGEGVAGSKAGELYLNCPSGASFGNMGSRLAGMVETDMSQPNTSGLRSRVLTHGLGLYGHQDQFWNGTPVGTGWFAFSVPAPNNASIAQQVYMAKRLPFPADDGLNRSDYLSFPVPIAAPAGVSYDNAVVQFGYDPSYRCGGRNEACVKGAQAGNEFDFAGDSVAGVPISAGSLNIPVLSQRVLYYQILYRNAAGATVAPDGPHVAVTP